MVLHSLMILNTISMPKSPKCIPPAQISPKFQAHFSKNLNTSTWICNKHLKLRPKADYLIMTPKPSTLSLLHSS